MAEVRQAAQGAGQVVSLHPSEGLVGGLTFRCILWSVASGHHHTVLQLDGTGAPVNTNKVGNQQTPSHSRCIVLQVEEVLWCERLRGAGTAPAAQEHHMGGVDDPAGVLPPRLPRDKAAS